MHNMYQNFGCEQNQPESYHLYAMAFRKYDRQQIREKFDLTYSVVSLMVGVLKDLLRKNSGLYNGLNRVKALIKI